MSKTKRMCQAPQAIPTSSKASLPVDHAVPKQDLIATVAVRLASPQRIRFQLEDL
jgi:hypothetical protein